MLLTRRAFLRTAAGSAIAVPALVSGQQPDTAVFRHGVASGDPLSNSVVLWTRVTPRASTRSVRVGWRVMTEASRIVRSGAVATTSDRDFTVKIDVGGLEAGRPYLYEFDAEGERSVTGQTRTLPQAADRVRLAVVSCSNYPAGFFNAYAALAKHEELDAVVHLGDYIYEFANGTFGDGTSIGRIPDPEHEALTLDDYRRRYATYRGDPDLQEIHRRLPFIAVWDDHEFADNAFVGGVSGWADRRAAAMRAYLEWIPVREPRRGEFHLYRSFRFGQLAGLTMLDTRSERDGQVFASDAQALADPRRRLIGAAQERWLHESLRAGKESGVTWSLIGQQVMFSPFTQGTPVNNPDAWDGYLAERARIRELLAATGNAVIMSGDVHSSWAFDVPLDPWRGYHADTGDGSIAVELITPAISSQPYFTGDQRATLEPGIRRSLPHLKYLEGENRGYMLLDITRERVAASWYHTPDVLRRSPEARVDAAFVIEVGSFRLKKA
jgi:alkaline phosphatase D